MLQGRAAEGLQRVARGILEAQQLRDAAFGEFRASMRR
jgi:hypothetical protein